ncbi:MULTISPECIES: hypothetical protein [Pseudomonas]|uniref:hypothetical protein n=1 Tax=Pseudomonas TaxID=286 RepID=UPI0004D7E493|nr:MULTISPECIES: hypothetical protein [Pseudomonas]KES20041.1 hypothetical protein FG99_00785 [Pseudomonas sp. AAC]MDU4251199.1 hypothetical protein [Pseudomonas sp.]NMZ75023.1 hypothetical protein [Pseudomonas nitroreducens]OBY59525.1 hypothetical protein A9513_027860 [Pseudomonas sp. AU12215]OHS15592.1 hypothetical protein HMPREF3289_05845 [Pseudomonas sp. HMSC75E02]
MTAVTKGFASRLGFGVGRTLRFFMNDRKVGLRWVKRAFLVTALLVVLVNSFSWLLGSLLTVGCLGLALYALVRGDADVLKGVFSEDKDAPYGRDVFGRELDSWGNIDGEYLHSSDD